MENRSGLMAFDMGDLKNNLPKKRGLSRYYSGKARSFICISDVKCLQDLQKPIYLLDDDYNDNDHDDNASYHNQRIKKKKKMQSFSSSYSFSHNNNNLNFPNYPCRRVSSSTHFSSPCVGA